MNHEACAEINLNNFAYNIHAIQQRVSPSKVILVLKSDAYGHSAVPVTKRLASE
jgi:alanine racemase